MIVAGFVRPVLFEVFGIQVYSYGVMVASALAACTLVLSRDLDRLGIKAEASTLMVAFLPGFWLGSKMQMVASAVLSGTEMPSLGLETGHSFMGSAVGGILTAALYGAHCGLRPLPLLDLLTPLVPLGHAVGKWGCFLSGDGCYGPPAPGLPWGMSFPNGAVPVHTAVHPTPLYESFLSGLLFASIHFIFPVPAARAEPRRLRVGLRAALTLVCYGIVRVLIEPFRRHMANASLLGLTEYQFLALVFIAIGIVIVLLGSKSPPWPLLLEDSGARAESKAKEA